MHVIERRIQHIIYQINQLNINYNKVPLKHTKNFIWVAILRVK